MPTRPAHIEDASDLKVGMVLVKPKFAKGGSHAIKEFWQATILAIGPKRIRYRLEKWRNMTADGRVVFYDRNHSEPTGDLVIHLRTWDVCTPNGPQTLTGDALLAWAREEE